MPPFVKNFRGTYSYSGELEFHQCHVCDIPFAIPVERSRRMIRQRDNGVKQDGVSCPNGHFFVYGGKSKVQRLEEQRDRAESLATERLGRLERERKSHSATKGQLTKTKNRIAKGICPVQSCHRSYVNVANHMKKQHPDFVEEV
jgi:hypothetical protein